MCPEHNNQPKEGCAAKICLIVAMDDGSVGGDDGKDASSTAAMMPVQQGHWHGHNNGKEASNRANVLGNKQPSQWKDKRADKRSGVEDMTRLQWSVWWQRLFLVTKALFGDGGGRRQERGVNTTIRQKRDVQQRCKQQRWHNRQQQASGMKDQEGGAKMMMQWRGMCAARWSNNEPSQLEDMLTIY
jgi:hypothetical protein